MITLEVAKEIANFKGNILYLNGIASITPEVAKVLAKIKLQEAQCICISNALYLNGLATITPEVAEELSNFTGRLYLDGLKSVDIETAKKMPSISW